MRYFWQAIFSARKFTSRAEEPLETYSYRPISRVVEFRPTVGRLQPSVERHKRPPVALSSYGDAISLEFSNCIYNILRHNSSATSWPRKSVLHPVRHGMKLGNDTEIRDTRRLVAPFGLHADFTLPRTLCNPNCQLP